MDSMSKSNEILFDMLGLLWKGGVALYKKFDSKADEEAKMKAQNDFHQYRSNVEQNLQQTKEELEEMKRKREGN